MEDTMQRPPAARCEASSSKIRHSQGTGRVLTERRGGLDGRLKRGSPSPAITPLERRLVRAIGPFMARGSAIEVSPVRAPDYDRSGPFGFVVELTERAAVVGVESSESGRRPARAGRGG